MAQKKELIVECIVKAGQGKWTATVDATIDTPISLRARNLQIREMAAALLTKQECRHFHEGQVHIKRVIDVTDLSFK